MQRMRRLASLAITLLAGCGSTPDAPPGPIDIVPRPDGGTADSAGDSSHPNQDGQDAPLGDGPLGDGRSPAFGDLVIVDIPGTDCIPARAPALLLSEAASTASGFEKMGQLGERRFVFGAEDSAAVTFAYDGASPSGPILGPLAVAGQNGTLAALVAAGDGLGVQLYEANGKPEASAVALDGSQMAGP